MSCQGELVVHSRPGIISYSTWFYLIVISVYADGKNTFSMRKNDQQEGDDKCQTADKS